jgi:hypothetical protein
MVSFTLRQTTSIVEQPGAAPRYRVINQVDAAVGADAAVFVFRATTKAFEHYAGAADMHRWPNSYEEAQVRSLAYYRAATVSREWGALEDMYKDLDTTKRRVGALARDLTAQRDVVVIDRTTVIGAP